jgi:hypothetical protein
VCVCVRCRQISTANHNHGCTPPAAIEGVRACTMRRGVCVCVCVRTNKHTIITTAAHPRQPLKCACAYACVREQTHGPRTNARTHARTCTRAHTHRSRAGSPGRPGHGVATTPPQRPTHTHTHAHTHTCVCDTSTRTHTHRHAHAPKPRRVSRDRATA